jgi:hypothetical protein
MGFAPFFRSVVIDQIHVECLAVLESEHDTPIAGDRHAPVALQLPLERMQAIAGQIEITR